MMPALFSKLALYNLRMNQQICQSIAALPHEELWADRKAEFVSILGTLNHIMVIDLMLLARLNQHPLHPDGFASLSALANYPATKGIRQTLYRELTDFTEARDALDQLISDFVADTTEADYEVTLSYQEVESNGKSKTLTEPFYLLMQDLFNHQTHHRGQLLTLFDQLNIKLKTTDFLVIIADDYCV
jgi:uncharacterized damage-inducible protein DinB